MSEEQKKEEVFDAEKIKEDIKNYNMEQMQSMSQMIDTKVNNIIASLNESNKTTTSKEEKKEFINDAVGDMKELLEKFDMDESQANALKKFVIKVASSNNINVDELKKNIKDEVLNTVGSNSEREKYSEKASTIYPEINDKNSPLFKQARKEWESMDEYERSSPKAAFNAVRNAANELGIKPVALNSIKSKDSVDMDRVSSSTKKQNQARIDEEDNEFMSFFDIKNKDRYKEIVNEKRKKLNK